MKPNLALVAVVLVTTSLGFLPGITWAFAAGLMANLLIGDPLGSVPLALLFVAVIVSGGGRLLGGLVWVYPVLATFIGSIVADLTSLWIGQLVGEARAIGVVPFDIVLAAAVLNAAIAALLVYPVRVLVTRYVTEELPAW